MNQKRGFVATIPASIVYARARMRRRKIRRFHAHVAQRRRRSPVLERDALRSQRTAHEDRTRNSGEAAKIVGDGLVFGSAGCCRSHIPACRRASPGAQPLRGCARCFCASSVIASGPWRHLRSGLRRSVPKPLQGASTSTRSSFPASRFAARIVVAGQRDRMDVADLRARRARRERGQALCRDVHGVDPAGAAHQHGERERLAAGAGAVVGDHLAAPRRDQPGKELAPLVLNLDQAIAKKRVMIDRRFAAEAHAGRRIRRRLGLDTVSAQSRASTSSRDVRARFTRRSSGAGLRRPCAMASASSQPCCVSELLPKPVRQVGAHRVR